MNKNYFAFSKCSFKCCVSISSLMCKSSNKGLVINSSQHPFILFILRPFSYNTLYLFRYTTSYSCASFMMSVWSYHWWFGYPFATLLVGEWMHSNPWYVLKYHYSYRVEKWSSHIEKGFSPFPPPHMEMNGYCHHQRRFSNLDKNCHC